MIFIAQVLSLTTLLLQVFAALGIDVGFSALFAAVYQWMQSLGTLL